ncbi:MAG: hypothetical protein GY859_38750 [Desulfobacterales bacterium]|nr:hypothetical protein [Desulfobacterales bacterium]
MAEKPRWKKRARVALGAIFILAIWFLNGCSTMGPRTVPRDRFNYNNAIADSWKEQTLLNIVKLRYADTPLFVEVVSIVSGYTLESSASLEGTLFPEKAVDGDSLLLGAGGKYTDRPTITYAPITGQKFNQSFMTPIPPKLILFLMQSGWPVDLIFPLTVASVNGLRSRNIAGPQKRTGDPEYYRIITVLREIQKSGAVGMRIVKGKNEEESTVMFFYKKKLPPEVEAGIREFDDLLGLRPGCTEFTVNYGMIAASDQEIAMISRSMLHIMVDMSMGIDVPQSHVSEGRTFPTLPLTDGAGQDVPRLLTVRSGRDKPDNAFTAVYFKDHWFWIDDRNFNSKRTFSFLMILFSLTESGGKEGLPLVTIPTG